MKNRPPFLTRSALAISASLALSALPATTWALGLGRLSVQSAIGEVLRAEIDIASLTSEEAATLAVRIASPEAYRASGVEYNAALAGAQATLARRADGRPYLRVVGDRAVQEPFVDVILELNWASGRLVREFTLLLDPPTSRPAAPAPAAPLPVSPTLAQTAPAAAAAPAAPAPAPAARSAAAPARPRAPAPVDAAPAPVAKAPTPAPAGTGAGVDEYRVHPGDTLSRAATKTQRPGVSLDQMLVGLFRANPDAFLQSNMNRLKSGAVLSVPAGESLKSIAPAEARDVIQAQSVDFNNYRRRLAEGVPAAAAEEAGRQAKGRVTAAVDDKKQAAAGPADKLKLSGGTVKASAPEAQVSKATESRDNATRVAELTRNVDELKKLQQGASAVQSAPVPAASPAPAVAPAPSPVPAAVPAPAPTPSPGPATSTQAAGPSASAPSASTPPTTTVAKTEPGASPSPKPTAAPAPKAGTAPEPSIVDTLSESPYLLPGAGALVLALLGLGLYRQRTKRGAKDRTDTSFLESRAQPDSFFGATGGQRVDTSDASAGSSSMGFSLSQLDAIGDVDPVAEADVYLAYGRDLQAEEILKEAMRSTPDRMAVRTKLLEVYAKRRDTKGFELLAVQLYVLTKGTGADWEKAQALGLQLDPDNPLYRPGGAPKDALGSGVGGFVEPLSATTMPASSSPKGASDFGMSELTAPTTTGPLDLDLDVDLGRPGELPVSAVEATRPLATQAVPSAAASPASTSLDFDLTAVEARDSTMGSGAGSPVLNFELDSMRMDLSPSDSPAAAPPVAAKPAAATSAPAAAKPPGIDFGDFMLSQPGDLGDAPTIPKAEMMPEVNDPIARKLELAEEFRQIGDVEGARDLLEEVIGKASGSLKEKAQRMLDKLG